MSTVNFHAHSTYSVGLARAWRTDNVQQDILKGGEEEEIEQEPGSVIKHKDDKIYTIIPTSSESSSMSASISSSSSSSSSIAYSSVESQTSLADLMLMMQGLHSKFDKLDTRLKIKDRQIENLVTMGCGDKLLSMVLCGHLRTVRDRGLTEQEKQVVTDDSR